MTVQDAVTSQTLARTLAQSYDGDVAIFQAVARVYLNDSPRQVEAVRARLAARDAPGLAAAAHTLKGAAANFSETWVTRTAQQIERLAATGDVDAAELLMARLDAEAKELDAALARYVAEVTVA